MRFVLLLVLISCLLQAEDRWVMQFFHDKDDSELTLNDIAFATPERGVAVGYLRENRRVKPVAVVTSDGGAEWSFVPTKEAGISVFFFDVTSGWMVTEEGIWFTDEAGRSWRKLFKRRGLRSVYFTTRERGWAIGAQKTVLETGDGGETWKEVESAGDPKTSEQYTTYNAIDFADTQVGIIAGNARRPRFFETGPVWLDPEPEMRYELPSTSVLLETRSGGEKWSSGVASTFGKVSRVEIDEAGRGLALIEFQNFFRWPSELMRLDLRTGKSFSVLKRKDRAVTDIALIKQGPAFAAGMEPSGILYSSPMPGKLKVLRSENLKDWIDGEVDYRAVARRVSLSAIDGRNAWVATDTGMILKLAAP